jgi:hypothetical protein
VKKEASGIKVARNADHEFQHKNVLHRSLAISQARKAALLPQRAILDVLPSCKRTQMMYILPTSLHKHT